MKACCAAATPNRGERLVTDFLDYLMEIAVDCDREDMFAAGTVLLTAGGSTFYDLVARRFANAGVQRPLHGSDPQRLLSHP